MQPPPASAAAACGRAAHQISVVVAARRFGFGRQARRARGRDPVRARAAHRHAPADRRLHDPQPGPCCRAAASRITEVLLESVPQGILQGYVYLQTDAPTTLQRVSLFGSLAAAGYILASVDYDMARPDSPELFWFSSNAALFIVSASVLMPAYCSALSRTGHECAV